MKKAVYEIDIPLFDLEEQRIIEKRCYKVELFDDFLKMNLEFGANETDDRELFKLIGDIGEDEILKNSLEKPTKDVYRKEILFINKEDISSIVYSKSSELKYAEIIVNYQSESQSFFFNSKRKAIEYIEALSNWRWNILTSP